MKKQILTIVSIATAVLLSCKADDGHNHSHAEGHSHDHNSEQHAGCSHDHTTQNSVSSEDVESITSMMRQSEMYWNTLDFENFLEIYEKSDSLKLVSANGIHYGHNGLLEMFQIAFPNTSHSGDLTFEIINFEYLGSNDYVLCIGKTHMKMAKGSMTGHFSAILKKTDGKWRIIADHSS